MVGDEARTLENASGYRDGGTAGADHFRQKLLGKVKSGLTDAVRHHEEPTREALLHFVEAVAGGDLAGKERVVLNRGQDDLADGLLGEELLFEALELEPEGGRGDLHEAVIETRCGTEEMESLGGSFTADQAGFDSIP